MIKSILSTTLNNRKWKIKMRTWDKMEARDFQMVDNP